MSTNSSIINSLSLQAECSSQKLQYVLSKKDGHRMFIREWEEKGPLRAVVCHIHGLAEHISRYGPFFTKLSGMGIRVIGFDHRGHGITREINKNSELVEVPIEDIDSLIEYASASASKAPLFLMGHSMGGLLALSYALDPTKAKVIAGVILTSPAIRHGSCVPEIKVKLGSLAAKILPNFRIPHGLDLTNISRDPSVVQSLRDDKLYQMTVPLYTANFLVEEGIRLQSMTGPKLECPLLILQGSADRLVDPEATLTFYNRVECDDKMIEMIEGGYHARTIYLNV